MKIREQFHGMHFPDPENVMFAFFEDTNDEPVLEGKPLSFYIRGFFIVIGFLAFRCFSERYFPSIIEIIFGIIFSVFVILFTAMIIYESTRLFLWIQKSIFG